MDHDSEKKKGWEKTDHGVFAFPKSRSNRKSHYPTCLCFRFNKGKYTGGKTKSRGTLGQGWDKTEYDEVL